MSATEENAGAPDSPRDEQEALARQIPVVYRELHALAKAYMRQERRGHTLQTTALINEAYLRIAGRESVDWANRAQFLGIAAQAMRRLLIDHARQTRRQKRGGGRERVPLREMSLTSQDRWLDRVDLLALDEALDKLKKVNSDHARLVELRFFGGLTIDQTAEVMKVSASAVERGWRAARAWLYRELGNSDSAPHDERDHEVD